MLSLRPYQQDGADFLLQEKRAILADAMGVGKTPQLITAARGKTLVVCPASLVYNWHEEISKWEHGADFTVTSYHSLVDSSVKDGRGKVAGKLKEPWRRDWDTVIADEAHHIKGRNTGYAKAFVGRLAPQAEYLYLSTGTPVKNWAHEVFMLCRALYPKDPRFSSYWRWADKWFTVYEEERWDRTGKKRFKVQQVGGLRSITDWETFVHDNGLSERWLRRTLDDPEVEAHIPPLSMYQVKIPLASEQGRVYRQMERDFFSQVDPEQILINDTTGGQWADLQRISSGLNFHPDLDYKGGNRKLDVMEDLISGLDGEQLVVFAHYRSTVDGLAEWFRNIGATVAVHGGKTDKANARSVEAFQRGDEQFMVGSYGVLAEGHTLTSANKMVLFESYPVPTTIDQATGRIRRLTQDKPTTVWQLVAADTVDDYYVNELIPAKRSHQEGVYTAADYWRWKNEQ